MCYPQEIYSILMLIFKHLNPYPLTGVNDVCSWSQPFFHSQPKQQMYFRVYVVVCMYVCMYSMYECMYV